MVRTEIIAKIPIVMPDKERNVPQPVNDQSVESK